MDEHKLLGALADVARRQATIRARDAALKASLTETPTFVPEWDEYAAATLAGVVYGPTWSACAARLAEAGAVAARHRVTA